MQSLPEQHSAPPRWHQGCSCLQPRPCPAPGGCAHGLPADGVQGQRPERSLLRGLRKTGLSSAALLDAWRAETCCKYGQTSSPHGGLCLFIDSVLAGPRSFLSIGTFVKIGFVEQPGGESTEFALVYSEFLPQIQWQRCTGGLKQPQFSREGRRVLGAGRHGAGRQSCCGGDAL